MAASARAASLKYVNDIPVIISETTPAPPCPYQ